MMNKHRSLLALTLTLTLISCRSGKAPTDTPTSGEIRIAADESTTPLVQAELDVFHGLYKYATITPVYTSEQEAFKLLIQDSVRLAIAGRNLNEEELNYFKEKKITPRVNKIALDALVLIVNRENPDSILSSRQVNAIFSGKTATWKTASKGADPAINIVFDHSGSGILGYIRNKFQLKELPKNFFALDGNPEVIEYVSKNKNALGLIGLSWVSDGDDPASLGFLNSIRVVAISTDSTKEAVQPYQAYISTGEYPLIREIFVVSREARAGLGTGFAAFLASDKGQRIVLKSGLLPATMPVRLIHMEN